jgi:hypothetical protein
MGKIIAALKEPDYGIKRVGVVENSHGANEDFLVVDHAFFLLNLLTVGTIPFSARLILRCDAMT